METNNLERRLPWMARLINVEEKSYWDSSGKTRNAINNLGFLLLISLIVSGFIFAAAICTFVLNDFRLFGVVFLLAALFYYVLKRPMVFSSGNQPNRKMIWLVICIVLALFNSIVIDHFFFREDINAAKRMNNQKEADVIRATFDAKNAELYENRQGYVEKIDSINGYLSELVRMLSLEVDGPRNKRGLGPEAKLEEYRIVEEDSDRKIALYKEEVSVINMMLESNNKLMDEKITVLYGQTGLNVNENLKILHSIVFEEGSLTNITMWVVIFMLCVITELCPMISSRFYDTSEYFELLAVRSTIDLKVTEINLQTELAKTKLANTAEYYNGMLEVAKAEYARIDEVDRKYKERFPDQYDLYFREVFEDCYRKIHEAIQEKLEDNPAA